MKIVAIIIFDNFTDIDLFLMWDILSRNKMDWHVRILGIKNQHHSVNGLLINTHGYISEANDADIVLFTSGEKGVKAILKDQTFLKAFKLNSEKQLIGSICTGAFILAALGLLNEGPATTHPRAKAELQAFGVKTIDAPLVCNGNVATAGGCLSAQYLVAWIIERIYGIEKRKVILSQIAPAGQYDIYEKLVTLSIEESNKFNHA